MLDLNGLSAEKSDPAVILKKMEQTTKMKAACIKLNGILSRLQGITAFSSMAEWDAGLAEGLIIGVTFLQRSNLVRSPFSSPL